MSLLRRISNVFSRSKVKQEIDAELESHIAMRMEDNIASGMPPEQARRGSRKRLRGLRAVIGLLESRRNLGVEVTS